MLSASRSFDAFDRWGFTKDYVNPVYALIGSLHMQSGIEINAEVSRKNRIIRYEAPTLYHTSAYDPYGYARNKYERPSQSKIALGSMLFRSTDLSKSGSMSCASCHDPQRAFMDGHAKSPGSVPHSKTDRNTPGLLNVALSPRYFHDSRTTFLEEQIEHVVSSSIEFNTDYFEISQRLSQDVKILEAFKSAYPSESGPINATTISSALSAYIRSLVSFETPVDSVLRGEKSALLTGKNLQKVKNGFNLFMGKAACGTCHFPPTFSGLVPPHFTDMESEVLGVPTHPTSKKIDPDLGKGAIYKYKSPIYAHAFKTPGLRNISRTAPYMHNGAYRTLQEVMDFYNRGGGIGIGTDVPNQTLPSEKLNLTKQEIAEIIAFMNALVEKPKY
jgi:cytochrome c peroxidase